MTLAPELPGASALIERLLERGVTVSLGHSDATAEQANAAFDLGVAHRHAPLQRDAAVPAPRPGHRRRGARPRRRDRPADPRRRASRARDRAGRLARGRRAGSRSSPTRSPPPARARATTPSGASTSQVRDGTVRGPDGVLAGSVLTMIEAVRNLHELGVPLAGGGRRGDRRAGARARARGARPARRRACRPTCVDPRRQRRDRAGARRRRRPRRRLRCRGALAAAALVAARRGRRGGRGPTPPLARLVGQKIMTGIDGATPGRRAARADPGRRGRRRHPLRRATSAARPQVAQAIAELQAAAAAGGNPPLLIAVDQEGGAVKRLPDGPPDLSPAAMGDAPPKARAEGAATGAYLRRLGVDVDLAPGARHAVRARRAGSAPARSAATRRVNAQLGPAFVAGLQQRRRRGDRQALPGPRHGARDDRHGRRRARDARSGARRAARSRSERRSTRGVDLVMVSNAGYTAYDPTGTPAVLSRPIVTGLLREQLGFGAS